MSSPPSSDPGEVLGTGPLAVYVLLAVLVGVLVAGFWNYHLVDGFGREVVAGTALGDTGHLAENAGSYGADFGFIFGLVAGLAATFTACNCVVFAMMPGLMCSRDGEGRGVSPLRALTVFTLGVLGVSGVYGALVGTLGPETIEWMNQRSVRLFQARVVFSALGAAMLLWGGFEVGLFGTPDWMKARVPDGVGVATTTLKAGLLGVFVGLFAVGRPFPVFREFLTYAARIESPVYGAGAMAMQGVGQIAVMVLVFLGIVWLFGRRLARWTTRRPHQPYLVSGLALLGGGSFFVFYWGLALTYDIGQWGFKLGWY